MFVVCCVWCVHILLFGVCIFCIEPRVENFILIFWERDLEEGSRGSAALFVCGIL